MKLSFVTGNNGREEHKHTPSFFRTRDVPRKNDKKDEAKILYQLVGLEEVKNTVKEIEAYVKIQRQRKEHGLKADNLSLHMIFQGNPGTGKSAVARALGSIFYHHGVLPVGNIIEVERADLVGEYIGHTAQKTREKIEKARGGILFVDEAYSLARGGRQDFGKEAIDVMVKAMEDYRDEFLLILAGYPYEMEYFLNLNPGLRSRIPHHINFPDFTVKQLLQIADKMLEDYQYSLTPGARNVLRKHLSSLKRNGELSCGNARLVRNLLEKSIRRQALRLAKRSFCSREELVILNTEDLE